MSPDFFRQCIVLVITWLLPVGWFFLTWASSPSYIDSFIHSTPGVILTCAVFGVHTVLCVFAGVACFLGWSRGLLTFFVSVSTFACCLVPMLGPAMLTIFQALGPMAQ